MADRLEPFGHVTLVKEVAPNHVDRHFFYRWPNPPYLDNAAECHAVYTAAQLAAALAQARAEERERMADMIERMTRLRRAARAALNDMPIQPCEFAAAIRQASEQSAPVEGG